jgi:acyl carrier protein
MERQEILGKLQNIIENDMFIDLPNDELSEDHDMFDDLGFDDLDRLYFLMNIEKEFDLSIDDEEFDRFTTIGEVISYLEKYGV